MEKREQILEYIKNEDLVLHNGKLIKATVISSNDETVDIDDNINTNDLQKLYYNYKLPGSSNQQKRKQINIGIDENIDVSLYASPQFSHLQMMEIRWGLELGLNVGIYAIPEFSYLQMREILYGLVRKLYVWKYANSTFAVEKMQLIRENLERELGFQITGQDVSAFFKVDSNWHIHVDEKALMAQKN